MQATKLWCGSMLVLLGLLAGACTPLQPVQLPREVTSAPKDTPFWRAVESATPHDWHALLNEGPDALDWRLRAIDSAAASIDLQTFLWYFDTAGALVLDHLVAAADRGVLVRVLIDDTFLASQDPMLLALAEHPNIEYRVFNPFERRSGSIATRQLLNLAEFSRLDHRMHNKAMVVDNHVAIVGGRNLADEYFGLHGDANFRDLELLLGGPVVREVAAAFDDYWNDPWSFPIATLSHAKASPQQLDEARRMREANAHVHDEESRAERIARWRELIARSDTGDAILLVDDPHRERYMLAPVDAKTLSLHAKSLIIDGDKVFIGSANLDPRSLRINTEMGFLIVSEGFNAEVRAAVEDDFRVANAWRLELQEDGSVHWVGADRRLASQPASSATQQIEDWFLSHLPIESEL